MSPAPQRCAAQCATHSDGRSATPSCVPVAVKGATSPVMMSMYTSAGLACKQEDTAKDENVWLECMLNICDDAPPQLPVPVNGATSPLAMSIFQGWPAEDNDMYFGQCRFEVGG